MSHYYWIHRVIRNGYRQAIGIRNDMRIIVASGETPEDAAKALEELLNNPDPPLSVTGDEQSIHSLKTHPMFTGIA